MKTLTILNGNKNISLKNAKIRAVYTNICTTPLKVRMNYHLYKEKQ